MDLGKYLAGALNLTVKHPVPLVLGCAVAVLAGAATLGILAPALTAGAVLMFVKAHAGGTPAPGDVFKPLGRTFPLLGAALVHAVAIFLGTLLLVVPGLILAARWMYALPLMADKGMGMGEAQRRSAEMVQQGGTFMHVVFLLVLAVVGGSGSLLAGVGALLTVPLSVGALGLGYAARR